MATRARHPGLVDNPPWVTKALADAWPSLEAKVKPQWLPRLEDVHSKRGHIAADLAEYGCGAYGCVLPTLDKEIVLKVTTDETEAEFAAYLSKDLVVKICTTYRMVMSIPAEHEGRRIYLLWREEAHEVGGITAGSAADKAVYTQHKAAQAAYDLIAEGEVGRKMTEALEAWKRALEAMARVADLKYVATGMLAVFEQQRIFFGDIHGGNLGKVMREVRVGKGQFEMKPTWVITDPGHVAVVGEPEQRAQPQAREHHRANPARPTVTLHGLLPPSPPTVELEVTAYRQTETNHFTNTTREVVVLRAVGHGHAYSWNADTLVDIGDEEIAVPGGMWITGMIAARDFALGEIVEENPHQEGIGTWKAPQIFADTLNARMLRLLWERGSMTQAEFMQRYHKVGAQLEGERRPTRITEGKTAFLNNLGRYVRGRSFLPSDYMPDQAGIQTRPSTGQWKGGRTTLTADADAYKRSNLIREQAVKYLQPIERRNQNGMVVDGDQWGVRAQQRRELRGKEIITLHWVGPTVEEWLTALTTAELDKAYQSMERVLIESDDPLDATWVKRLQGEIAKRGGAPADWRPRQNPPSKTTDELDAKVATLLLDPSPGSLDAIRDVCLEQDAGVVPGKFIDMLAGVGERLFDKHYADRPISHKAMLMVSEYGEREMVVDLELEDPAGQFDDAEDVAFARTATDANPWPWCSVTVRLTLEINDGNGISSFTGRDDLGGCSYRNQNDFEVGGYYGDMIREAASRVVQKMPRDLVALLAARVIGGRFDLGDQRACEWALFVSGDWMRNKKPVRRVVWTNQYGYANAFQTNIHSNLEQTIMQGRRHASAYAWLSIPLVRTATNGEDLEYALMDALTDRAERDLLKIR